jgi:hypothetical protein
MSIDGASPEVVLGDVLLEKRKPPAVPADEVRLYAENKRLKDENDKLNVSNDQLRRENTKLERQLSALYSLIERLD